jgi:hypothetical protein
MNKLLSPPLLFRLMALVAVCLLIGGLAISAASANGVSPYSVSWYTFDGGGGVSTSPGYTIMGTIGQPDAGLQNTSTGYNLTGGFWTWLAKYLSFAPLIRKP